MERKLATVRKIANIEPIPNADQIELATIDGWKVVVAKNVNHKIGDFVVYCEVDSFLPIKEEFEFLRKSSYKKMGDQEGFRLKTIRLRQQISQGLILPIDQVIPFPDVIDYLEVGKDVSELLGIVKYEPPIPAELSGKVKGNFPSFIPKTDEERIQNLTNEFDGWKDETFYITEKLDGCLDGSTMVETENGNMTIRNICESNYNGKVKSYNVETGEIEYRKVKNTFINTPTAHQWFNIKLENGNEIKITGNHRVWLPELVCWRRVDELKGDETFLLKN